MTTFTTIKTVPRMVWVEALACLMLSDGTELLLDRVTVAGDAPYFATSLRRAENHALLRGFYHRTLPAAEADLVRLVRTARDRGLRVRFPRALSGGTPL